VCSIEGDILVSNLIRPEREASGYLIPSLSMLKGKVDRVFGSQPMLPLSQKRKDVDVDKCGSRAGKEQFRAYAEIVLGMGGDKKDGGAEKDVDIHKNMDKGVVKETYVITHEDAIISENVINESIVNENTITHTTPITATSTIHDTNHTPTINHSVNIPIIKSNSISNTPVTIPDNSLISTSINNDTPIINNITNTPINNTTNTPINNTTNTPINNITNTPINNTINTTHPHYRRYRFAATPPSPSSLPSLLRSHDLPPALFPIIHQVTDFDTNSVLAKCRLADDLPRPRGNRCDFWREILSQQFPSQPQRLFRRYVYSKPPPRLSAKIAPSSLPTQMTVFLQLGTLWLARYRLLFLPLSVPNHLGFPRGVLPAFV